MSCRFAAWAIAWALLAAGCAGAGAGAPEETLRPFRVIGHRAAAGHAPENTLPALAQARALDLREVEVDVRMSRDGRLVLFHDGTLDEKTELSGAVSEGPQEVRKARAGSRARDANGRRLAVCIVNRLA